MDDPSEKPGYSNYLSLVVIGVLSSLFLLAVFPSPFAGAGYFWDFSNALGLAGFGGLVILSLSSSKPLEVSSHKLLSYVVVLLCLAHALMLALGDGAVFTYLRPGAPWSMWAALASFASLVVLLWHAQRPLRRKLHSGYHQFATWHRYLAILVIVLAAWHIIDSTYYFQETYQLVIVAIICSLAGLRPLYSNAAITVSRRAVWFFVSCSLLMVIVFTVLRNYSV